MLIIGERINSTRQKVREAIKARNASFILKEAVSQLEAGASFLDLNCAATTGDEIQDIEWVVSVIQNEIKDVSISIDSPNHLAIEMALKAYKAKGEVMINSITGEDSRIKSILPLARQYKAKVIALTMDEKGMPNTAKERLELAQKILAIAKKNGVREEDVYFDPLIRPIATEPAQAAEFLNSLLLIKSLRGARTVCGLSNVSFGLPDRSLMNAAFLAMAVQNGLDAAIIDPLDKTVFSSLRAARALLGKDDYCADYIKAFREGRLI
jgi:5-methyltetrahydrofolate--homocysteine methyltransferase